MESILLGLRSEEKTMNGKPAVSNDPCIPRPSPNIEELEHDEVADVMSETRFDASVGERGVPLDLSNSAHVEENWQIFVEVVVGVERRGTLDVPGPLENKDEEENDDEHCVDAKAAQVIPERAAPAARVKGGREDAASEPEVALMSDEVSGDTASLGLSISASRAVPNCAFRCI